MTRKTLLGLVLMAVMLTACTTTQASEDVITVSGFIEGRAYRLSAETGGTVVEVKVAQGDVVTAGQVLVRLEDPQVESAVAAAQAGVQAAQATLDSLRLLPTEAEVAQAQAALEIARAQRDAAQSVLQALKDAYAPFDPPAADLHAAEGPVRQAEAAVALAQARLDQVNAGPDPLDVQSAEIALEQAQVQLELARATRTRLTLTAPHDGVVQQVLVHPGEAATPGQVLVLLLDPTDLTLTVYLPEQHLGRVQVGDPVQVRVDAYPEQVFHGTVEAIADRAQFTPTTVQTAEERVKMVFAVRIRLENPNGLLKPGMPADAEFTK